mgnify:CR=1 FL=1
MSDKLERLLCFLLFLFTLPASLPGEDIPLLVPAKKGVGGLRRLLAPRALGNKIREVKLTLSKEQKEFFAQKTGWHKNREVSHEIDVSFDDSKKVRATIKAHGRSTLEYDKKSFALRLHHNFLTTKVWLDKFFLLSLVTDEHGFEMFFCNQILARMRLFPNHFQFVRLSINGKDQGLYLLIERTEDAIRRSWPNVLAIYRRRTRQKFEKVWLRNENEKVNEKETFDIDLNGYMHWLAFNSLIRNRDILDELFLYKVRTPAKPNGFWKPVAWDYDDTMRQQKNSAFSSPVLYGCESEWDCQINSSPRLFSRYCMILKRLLTLFLTPEALKRRLMFCYAELQQIDPRSDRKRAIEEYLNQLLSRRAELLNKLRALAARRK